MRYRGDVRVAVPALIVLALLAMLVAGCPEEQTQGEDTVVVPPEDTGVYNEPGTDPGTTTDTEREAVAVVLVDGEIEMPDTLPAGPTTFEVVNNGQMLHNLEIEGQGIEVMLDRDLNPGETGTMEVDLQPGEYVAYCPVGDHRERGMEMALTVTEQAN